MAAAPGPAAAAYAAALRAAEADPGLALELLRLQVPPRALRCPGGVLLLTLARLASVGGWGAGLRPVLPALRGRSERPLRAARSPGVRADERPAGADSRPSWRPVIEYAFKHASRRVF